MIDLEKRATARLRLARWRRIFYSQLFPDVGAIEQEQKI
jgi:hypothetical protein